MGEELERLVIQVLRSLLISLWSQLDARQKEWITRLIAVLAGIAAGALLIILGIAVARGVRRLSASYIERSGGILQLWNQFKRRLTKTNAIVIPAVLFLLFAAEGRWPYNFYILTRIVVCGTTIYLFGTLHLKKNRLWESAMAFLALLFNPIAPFHFAKSTWSIFNVIGALIIAPAIFVNLRVPESGQTIPVPTPPEDETFSMPSPGPGSPSRYRYCTDCRVRVGEKDVFCKRCGTCLE